MNIMADGALKQKLATYEVVAGKFADAIAQYKGDWVPTTIMGARGEGAGGNGAQALIDLFTTKVANDLALDMSVKKGAKVTE